MYISISPPKHMVIAKGQRAGWWEAPSVALLSSIRLLRLPCMRHEITTNIRKSYYRWWRRRLRFLYKAHLVYVCVCEFVCWFVYQLSPEPWAEHRFSSLHVKLTECAHICARTHLCIHSYTYAHIHTFHPYIHPYTVHTHIHPFKHWNEEKWW